MCTFSPVRGLTPMRAARAEVENLPKPVNVMASPFFNESRDRVQHGVDRSASLTLGHAGPIGYGVHEILLGHCLSS